MYEDSDILIKKATEKLISEQFISHNHNPESFFNQKFDDVLISLVLDYQFNFDLLAFRLGYLFPQYQSKISCKTVAYRWSQIHHQRSPRKTLQIMRKQDYGNDKELIKTAEEIFSEREIRRKASLQERKSSQQKLKLALQLARQLDQQQMGKLITYHPKFTIGNQYKLEREDFDKTRVEGLMNNQTLFDFGKFQAIGEFAGALPPQEREDSFFDQIGGAEPMQQVKCQEILQGIIAAKKEEEEYFDDDWQAYQSD